METLWEQSLNILQNEIPSKDFNTYVRPLQAECSVKEVKLFAPNRFVRDQIKKRHYSVVVDTVKKLDETGAVAVSLLVGGLEKRSPASDERVVGEERESGESGIGGDVSAIRDRFENPIDRTATFETYVEGESNQLARAAAVMVAENPGNRDFNPLYLYADTGLGKTHLIHAVANQMLATDPSKRISYVRMEKFVHSMVNSIRHNSMDQFKNYYRSRDVLLIDDIHMLAGKTHTQEEFFHLFNSLLESGQQLILTCDKYPTEIPDLEDRLKSRLISGMTVAIEPPELETRVAILISKSEVKGVALPEEVAFFIGKHIQSNVRELEGVLNRVNASARLQGKPISIDLAREALKDVLAIHDRRVTIDLIQRTVAAECNIQVKDMKSKKRNRAVARPRQLAMYLSRKLTKHSLPEIGEAFGGKDHTTVLHACRQIENLKEVDASMKDLHQVLVRKISGQGA